MLTEIEITANKKRFLELIDGINREGINKTTLIKQLEGSDFFTAPASTKYHNAYPGGLCEHCLNVYDNLEKLHDTFRFNASEETIRIVALLHDFSMMNYYITEIKNKKVYSDEGKKKDDMGKFDWVSYEGYTIKDPTQRLSVAGHEETAAFMANTFIPLTFEEYAAISNHHAGLNWDSSRDVWMSVYEKYDLAVYLHIADMIDSFNPEVRCDD